MDDLFYMQFSLKVLDVMKIAEQALTVSEYVEFLEAVKRLAEEKLDCVEGYKEYITHSQT